MNKIFPFKNKILFDVIIMAVLSIVALFMPMMTYVYNSKLYAIKGIRFLAGAVIMEGKTTIEPNMWGILVVVVAVLLIITSVIFLKVSPRLGGTVLLVLSVVTMAVAVIFSKTAAKIIENERGKYVTLSTGSIMLVIIAVLLLIRAFHILYKNKVVVALDFMALPGVLYFLINNYFPMFGIFIAFKKVDYSLGIWDSPWVGFDNFKYLFSTQDALIMTRNTILYNLVFIIVGTVLGIMLGMMLYEIISKTWQKIFQTTLLLPQLISMIIVAYIVFGFLSNEAGLINKTFLGENAIDFYSESKYWPFILTFVNSWKLMGYNAIIYMASIVGIDKSLYEAAKVDGASKWQQIRKITIPMLKPTIITLLIIQIGRIFYSDFGLFLQVPMNSGILYDVTQTIDTYVYRALMNLNQIGKASAASVYQSLVGFIIVIVVNGIVRKVDKENALF